MVVAKSILLSLLTSSWTVTPPSPVPVADPAPRVTFPWMALSGLYPASSPVTVAPLATVAVIGPWLTGE